MNTFQVFTNNETSDCFSPGDYITESFFIQNNLDTALQIRLQNVSNIDNSALYSVLQAGWITSNNPITFQPLSDITSSWYQLEGNSSLTLNLCLYFPKELGNDYQNELLEACFTFEGRYLYSDITEQQSITIITPSQITDTSTSTAANIPVTGDTASVDGILILVFLYLLFFVLLHHKRKGS